MYSFAQIRLMLKGGLMADDAPLWRDATQDDFEFLYSVLVAVRSPHKMYNEAFERERYTKNFDLEGLHVIQYKGQDAGRFRLLLNDESVHIVGLQILPAFQRLGIGSAIIHRVMHDAVQMGIDVVLEVFRQNTDAQRLYRRLGFVSVGTDPNNEDVIKMRFFIQR